MQVINLEATISTPTLQAEINTPSLQVEMRTLRLGGGGGGTTDYNDLSNKPKIEGVTLQGNVPISDLGLRTSDLINDSGFITTGDIPTKTSDLTNDSDFQTGAEVAASITAAIPTNVSYFTNDIGYITSAAVPTVVSAFTNDIGYLTINDLPSFAVNSVNGQTGDVVLDGSNLDYDANTSINDKIDNVENAIPTKTSDITNDSGYITAADIPVQSVNGQTGVIDLLEMGTVENAGTSVTVNDAGAAGVPYLTLDITPRQNLNGYDKPWAGGTGKNLLNYNAWKDVSITRGTAVWENNGVTLTATSNDCYTGYLSAQNFNAFVAVSEGDEIWISWEEDTDTAGTVFLFTERNGSWGARVTVNNATDKSIHYTVTAEDSGYISWRFGVANSGDIISYKNIQIEKGSSATSFEPYENNCPIYDWQEVILSVNGSSYTSTIYNCYGGTYDCIAGGGMNTYSHIASYAGESINEPWMSSLDEYIPGTTPTTGAEVVYLDEDNAVSRSGNAVMREKFINGANTITLDTRLAVSTIKKLMYFKNTTNEFLQKLVMLAKTNSY